MNGNEIAKGIHWVGVHFPRPPGASVNAFLIKDDETTLIDTGPAVTQEAVLGNIKKIVDPSEIKYIVLTHAEVDHCGGLKRIMEVATNAKVVASQIGAMMLSLYGIQTQAQVVKDGDVLNLGRRKLRFVFSPIVDTWDTLFVFEDSERILFSADAFSASVAEWKLFADADQREAVKALHKMKFPWVELVSPVKMAKALEKIRGLNPKIIAPGHGLMIRKDIDKYIDALAQVG